MKKVIKRIILELLSVIAFVTLDFHEARSQTLLASDDFGTTAQNPISRTGWTANPASGTAWELRTTSGSTGYSWTNPAVSASGGANVFTNLGTNTNTKQLTYDNSLSTVGYSTITVRFGGLKSGTVPTLNVLYSTDGTTYTSAGTVTLGTTWAAYSVVLPAGADNASNLRVRFEIVANNSTSNFIRIDDFNVIGSVSCTSPSTQATSLTFSNIQSTQMDLSFTRGNGNNVLVVAKAGSAPTDPSSGTSYTANSVYGSGTAVGGGFAVYNGTANTFTLTGLSPNTTYYFAIYEYNTTGTCYNLTELSGNQITPCNDPTTQSSAVTFSSVTSTTATISFTNGNGTNRLVVVKSGSAVAGTPTDGTAYTANTVFGSGSTIAASEYVVYANTGSSVSITGLTASTTYYVAVFEYNSSSNCYLTSAPATNSFMSSSASSDIVGVAASEAATISSLTNNASPLTSATGIQVWQFKVRDGGAGLNDADNLSTILTSFTISQAAGNAVSNWSTAIKTIELFDGTTNLGIGTVTTGPNQISFTGLNINVADNTEKTLSLRLSLNCGIGSTNSDGDDFGFQISNGNVTFSSTGSAKASFAATATTNGQNVITVVATQLQFSQQPTTTGQSQIMSPSVVVKATDACGNTDLGFTGNVSISSTGTMTGDPVTVAAVSGVATFSSIQHTVIGTGYTITASASGVTSVTSSTFDITVVTLFTGGDLAIVGICVNQGACGGSSGEDEISFVCFKDITPGTTIDITDNGYERVGCGSANWGNTEGVIRLTRTSTTLAAGTIITIRVLNNTLFTGLSPDNNWTIAYPVGTNFNLNNNDEQVYMLQGGIWSAGTSGSHDATYTGGTYMFGINTYTAWTCNDNTTTRGGLPDALKCFSVLPSTGTVNVKYTGPTTAANQKDWIDRLNSISNWTAIADCPTYNSTAPNYSGGYSFSIISGGFNGGYWTGATSTDWFDCNNWQNFKVPDSTTNVTVDNVTNDPLIGASPALYPTGAICNDMTVTSTSGAGVVTLNNAASYLSIVGNVTNNGTITATNGTVAFRSSANQTFGGSGVATLYNMTLNNTGSTGLSLAEDISVANTLSFTSGKISTGSNKMIITNTTVPAINGYSSAKFINGNLRQYITNNASTYVLPIGDGTASTNYKRADVVNAGLAGVSYIDASVATITESSNNIDSRIVATQNGSLLTDVLSPAIWALTPDASPTGGSYGVKLYVANTGLSASDDDAFCPVKRADASSDYADWDTFEGTTTIPAAGSAGRIYNTGTGYAERLGYTTFSKHAIAKTVSPLPVKLLYFKAKLNAKNEVELNWATLTEINNDHFEIQRSSDGLKFESILSERGAGNTNIFHNYKRTDESPLSGKSYYRLKQVDYNGLFEYSNVEMVSVSGKHSGLEIVNVSVSANSIEIVLKNSENETLSIELFDMLGNRIISEKTIHSENSIKLDASTISGGVYIVKVSNGHNSATRKIVKAE